MRFVTLFLKTENVHLLKDVGMIPYYLMKEHGVDSTVATYRNSEEYSYADNEVRGLKLDFVERTGRGPIIDGMLYLVRNAKRIDVLNIYHLNLSSYFYEIVYRLFNPKGKIYLKLDMNPAGLISCLRKDPVGIIKRATIRRADIASVETSVMCRRLKKFYDDRILYVPNGCYINERDDLRGIRAGEDDSRFKKKENIILTAGNLGTYEKATGVLLEAYAQYIGKSPGSDWKLKLVGSIEEDFKPYIAEYFAKHPDLKERVTFTGMITDKVLLNEEYERAKVFVLPSLSESFGIVLVEAAMRGCYLITSDMVPAGYDISHKHENGISVRAGDSDALAGAFGRICDEPRDWDAAAKKTAAYVSAAYDWSRIIDKLYKKLI